MYSAPVVQGSTSAPDVTVSPEENHPPASDIETGKVHSAAVPCDEVDRAEVPQKDSPVR